MRWYLRLSVIILFLLAAVASTPAAGPRDQMVVSAAWLNQHLKDQNLVVLHVGNGDTDYAKGHVPGARQIGPGDITAPMDHATMKPTDLHVELPTPALLRDHLAAAGISNNSKIVVYAIDGNASTGATRVIFTLDYAGLGANTVLLDGGLRAWTHDGFPTTTEAAPARTGTLAALKTTEAVVDAAFMTANRATPGVALIDARDQVFYDGLKPSNGQSQPPQLGHIPGAVSIPFSQIFDDAGLLAPADKLETIFAAAGVKPNDTVVAYCHVGIQATAVIFAARTLGHKVRLYDGSMNDWTARNLPFEVPIKKVAGRR